MEGDFPVVESGEDHIQGSPQLGPRVGDIRRLSGHPHKSSIGLGIFVVRVAPGGHEFHLRVNLTSSVQTGKERPRTVELIIQVGLGCLNPVVRRAAKNRVGNIRGSPEILDVIADGVPPSGAAHQDDLLLAGAGLDFSHFGRKLLGLVGGTAPVLLRFRIVAACCWMGKVDGMEERTVITIRLEAPDGRMPEGGAVPVAVNEENGRR